MRYLILKEYLKFKFAFWMFLASVCFCAAWCYFDMSGASERFGLSNYALQVMFNQKFTFHFLDALNIVFAVLIGLSSMFAERQMARIRVQFHFPLKYWQNFLILTSTPLVFLLFVFAVEILLFSVIFGLFFQHEVVAAMVSVLVYSCAFGVAMFWLAQGVIIEPNLLRNIGGIGAGMMMSYIYFIFNPDIASANGYFANDRLGWYILVAWVFGFIWLLLSLANYKKGYIK